MDHGDVSPGITTVPLKSLSTPRARVAWRRLGGGLTAALCVLVLGDCVGHQDTNVALKAPDIPPSEPPPPPKASSETFLVHYTFSFAGKLAVNGTFAKGVSRADYPSCRDYLIKEASGRSAGDNGASTLGFDNAPVQGGTVGFTVSARIHGPGTYPLGPSDEGNVSDGTGRESYIFSYGYEDGGRGTVTINDDGSATVVFSGWKNPSDEAESGSVSWACR
jgi:hypothetical protein